MASIVLPGIELPVAAVAAIEVLIDSVLATDALPTASRPKHAL